MRTLEVNRRPLFTEQLGFDENSAALVTSLYRDGESLSSIAQRCSQSVNYLAKKRDRIVQNLTQLAFRQDHQPRQPNVLQLLTDAGLTGLANEVKAKIESTPTNAVCRLNLSTPARTAVKRGNYTTIDDLLRFPPHRLHLAKFLSARVAPEILEALKPYRDRLPSD